jgi:hypothetical protein
VQLTAAPARGYVINKWTGTNDDSSVNTTNYVTMNGNKTVSVVFTAIPANAAITPVAWKQSNANTAARAAGMLSNATGMNGTQTYLYNLDGSIPGEPTTADNAEWVTTSQVQPDTAWTLSSCMAAGKVWIVFDMGASYDFGTIKIWNFQWKNGTSDLSNRGVSQFDVYVRDSVADTSNGAAGGTAINLNNTSWAGYLNTAAAFNLGTSNRWQLALSDQQIAQSPNNDTYVGQSYTLPCTGRFVAIVADSHYGGAGIGLGKVRFKTGYGAARNPDPANGEMYVVTNLSNRSVPGAVSWQAPTNPNIAAVFGYNLYMDTNETRVANATPASTDLLYKSLQSGGQTGTRFAPGANLEYSTTYYWRVDAIVDLTTVPGNTINDASTLTGGIWRFTTIPYYLPPVLTFYNVITTLGLLPAELSATVIGSDPITSVVFTLLTDDTEFPPGAAAKLTNTTINNQNPTATLTTNMPGTYKVRLEVSDGATTVEEIAEVVVYANPCEAKKNAPSGWTKDYFDSNDDCIVNLADLVNMADEWLHETSMTSQKTYEGDVVYNPAP